MPHANDLLYPPILQILEEGYYQRTHAPGVSAVITWIDFSELDHTKYKLRSKRRPQTPLSYLMKTIDLRDAEPAQEGIEHFSYIVRFPDDEREDPDHSDAWESRTIFKEGRPSTSRGFHSGRKQHGRFQGVLSSLARKLGPSKRVDAFLSSRFSSNRYNSVETISRIISHHSCSGTPDRKAHLIYATLIRIAFGTRQFYIAPSPAHPSIDDYISDNWYSFAALHLLNAFLVNHPLHLVHIPTDPTSLATYCFPTFLALTFAFLGHHKLLK